MVMAGRTGQSVDVWLGEHEDVQLEDQLWRGLQTRLEQTELTAVVVAGLHPEHVAFFLSRGAASLATLAAVVHVPCSAATQRAVNTSTHRNRSRSKRRPVKHVK